MYIYVYTWICIYIYIYTDISIYILLITHSWYPFPATSPGSPRRVPKRSDVRWNGCWWAVCRPRRPLGNPWGYPQIIHLSGIFYNKNHPAIGVARLWKPPCFRYFIIWWFGVRNMFFPSIGNSTPHWLIFFRGVETTNQMEHAGFDRFLHGICGIEWNCIHYKIYNGIFHRDWIHHQILPNKGDVLVEWFSKNQFWDEFITVQ